jgi:hypothetical protein
LNEVFQLSLAWQLFGLLLKKWVFFNLLVTLPAILKLGCWVSFVVIYLYGSAIFMQNERFWSRTRQNGTKFVKTEI